MNKMIRKVCIRCKGKGGRFLKPRTSKRNMHGSTTKTWVDCDMCKGTKTLSYPYTGGN